MASANETYDEKSVAIPNFTSGDVQLLDTNSLKLPIYNINFWIGNDLPPPLELFRKFIRFGTAILPSVLDVMLKNAKK